MSDQIDYSSDCDPLGRNYPFGHNYSGDTAISVGFSFGSEPAIHIRLSNMVEIKIPLKLIQGLDKIAAYPDIGVVEIIGGGTGISFPELNHDLSIPGLVRGIYGTEKWMSELGWSKS
jgi:hypothetical protein